MIVRLGRVVVSLALTGGEDQRVGTIALLVTGLAKARERQYQ